MSTIKLQCPENVTSASHDGVEYPANDNGIVEVPSGAALVLYSHGFTNVPAKPAKAPALKPAAATSDEGGDASTETKTPSKAELQKLLTDAGVEFHPALGEKKLLALAQEKGLVKA